MLVRAARLAMRAGGAMLASIALATACQAEAATCWDTPSIGAARVSEFETLLLVQTLRCKSVGIDMQGGFDRMLAAHRGTLEMAHRTLRAKFGESDVKRASAGPYDRFVTGVANSYGAGKTEVPICQQFSALIEELGKGSTSSDFLISVAGEMVRDPRLDGAQCGQLASAGK